MTGCGPPSGACPKPEKKPFPCLPGRLETGDMILILILLLVWLEKQDEEILILLSALLVLSL